MNKELIHGMRIIIVVVLLLRVILFIDFSQSDSFSFFAIELELNECESEGTENENLEDCDEFFESATFSDGDFFSYSQSLGHFYFVEDVFTHIIEIVPPPPQG